MTRDGRLALGIAALCVVEFMSPPFERLNIFVYLFPVIAIGICYRDRGAWAAIKC